MPKRVVIMMVDGTTVTLKKIPSFDKMREFVGGFTELVKVLPLDSPSVAPQCLTYMVVDEEGRIKGKARNELATEIYLNLTRKQFPGVDNPFKKAKEEFLKDFPKGIILVGNFWGEEEEPFIAGDAIYFEGYTTRELDNIWNNE